MEKVILKAEFVNEIQFKPQTRMEFSEPKIIHPYTKEYEAQVAVKVGNLVHTITIKQQNKYIRSTYNGDKHVPSLDLYYFDLTEESKKLFTPIISAGIEIDFTDIYTQYFAELAKAEYHTLCIERYKKWVVIREKRNYYKNSWMHTFEQIIKADKNVKIVEAVKQTSFTIPSEDEIVKNSLNSRIDIQYRGLSSHITRQDGRYVFNSNNFYEYPNGIKPEKDYYNFKRHIINTNTINGITKKAQKEGTIYLKMVEAIDEYIAIRETQKTHNSTEAQKRGEIRAHLEDKAGYPVVISKETKYYSENRGRNHERYDVYTYFIITKQPTSSYSSAEGYSVSLSDTYGYIGEKRVPLKRTYGVKGITGLNEQKFKSILDIILEGKETFAEIIFPEKDN